MVAAAGSVRPSLRALLGLTAAATGVALWWPEDQPSEPGSLVASALVDRPESRPEGTPPGLEDSTAVALPGRLHRPSLEPASFDPFGGVRPPPPPPPPPPVAPMPLATTPVMAPVAPALNYRYLGRMTDPSGEQRIYLARGDSAVAVSVGTRLDEGYVVEAIDTGTIRLHYPPLGAQVRIPIPVRQEENSR